MKVSLSHLSWHKIQTYPGERLYTFRNNSDSGVANGKTAIESSQKLKQANAFGFSFQLFATRVDFCRCVHLNIAFLSLVFVVTENQQPKTKRS